MCSRKALHKAQEIVRHLKEAKDELLSQVSSDESDYSDDNLETLDQILEAEHAYEENWNQQAYLPMSPDESPTSESPTGETYNCICTPGGRWCTCRYLSEEDKKKQAE